MRLVGCRRAFLTLIFVGAALQRCIKGPIFRCGFEPMRDDVEFFRTPTPLNFERSESRSRLLTLKDRKSNIMNRNACGGFAIQGTVVSMTVQYQVCAMPIHHLAQA